MLEKPFRAIGGRATAAALALALVGGCQRLPWFSPKLTSDPPVNQKVPEPIDLLLPRSIHIHAFTGTRVFNEHGGITGIDVRVQAKDHFGDPAKAFGRFRFELFHYLPRSSTRRGDRIAVWTEDVLDPKVNRNHWQALFQAYRFKLGWHQDIPVGRKFALVVTFESPFTNRLASQKVFVAGQ